MSLISSSLSDHPDAQTAWCAPNPATAKGAADGPLSGLTFSVKDVFDIAGTTTGNGHPDWLASHAPATDHAPLVAKLLAAGADLLGRTLSDELCYSLTGENFHYGTPLNPAAPDHVPGGSSSGSASVVAAGACDFALGTDCGGSVRVPASYCGLIGMRPSHGGVTLAGCVDFAPSFDCPGWFTRDITLFSQLSRLLLDDKPNTEPLRIVTAQEALAILSPELQACFSEGLTKILAAAAPEADATGAPLKLTQAGLRAWSDDFRTLQGAEVWQSLGDWVTAAPRRFSPGVEDRLMTARTIPAEAVAAAKARRDQIQASLDQILTPGTILVLPTVPRVAPARGLPTAEIEVELRHLAMDLLCIAGLGGLPQISLPLSSHQGLPFGVSIVAGRGCDLDLVAFAEKIMAQPLASEAK